MGCLFEEDHDDQNMEKLLVHISLPSVSLIYIYIYIKNKCPKDLSGQIKYLTYYEKFRLEYCALHFAVDFSDSML